MPLPDVDQLDEMVANVIAQEGVQADLLDRYKAWYLVELAMRPQTEHKDRKMFEKDPEKFEKDRKKFEKDRKMFEKEVNLLKEHKQWYKLNELARFSDLWKRSRNIIKRLLESEPAPLSADDFRSLFKKQDEKTAKINEHILSQNLLEIATGKNNEKVLKRLASDEGWLGLLNSTHLPLLIERDLEIMLKVFSSPTLFKKLSKFDVKTQLQYGYKIEAFDALVKLLLSQQDLSLELTDGKLELKDYIYALPNYPQSAFSELLTKRAEEFGDLFDEPFHAIYEALYDAKALDEARNLSRLGKAPWLLLDCVKEAAQNSTVVLDQLIDDTLQTSKGEESRSHVKFEDLYDLVAARVVEVGPMPEKVQQYFGELGRRCLSEDDFEIGEYKAADFLSGPVSKAVVHGLNGMPGDQLAEVLKKEAKPERLELLLQSTELSSELSSAVQKIIKGQEETKEAKVFDESFKALQQQDVAYRDQKLNRPAEITALKTTQDKAFELFCEKFRTLPKDSEKREDFSDKVKKLELFKDRISAPKESGFGFFSKKPTPPVDYLSKIDTFVVGQEKRLSLTKH